MCPDADIHWAIPLKKDTPPVDDELAICISWDRNYAFYTMRQMLVHGNLQKMYGELQLNMETRWIPCRTN